MELILLTRSIKLISPPSNNKLSSDQRITSKCVTAMGCSTYYPPRYVQYLTWLYLSKDYSDYIIFLK